MDRLWAGWRMEYIRAAGETGGEPECLFCGLARQEPSEENYVLERYRHGFLVLNAFPYTSGHVMVAPYRHHDSLLGGGAEERAELLAALERVRHALTEEYEAQGFNIGVNLGRVAGAGVVGHLHWHMVPRWKGDTNFVPAVAEVRVMPEALPETYRRLKRALAGAPAEGVTFEERFDGA